MLENIILFYRDKTYLLFTGVSFILSGLTFVLFYQLIVKNERIWLAPIFTPIHFYVIVIFIINLLLSFITYKRDKILSLTFNALTIAVDIILIIALILNLVNPNG